MVIALPRRRANIDIEKTAQATIVHDRTRDYVHLLNERTCAVLEACNGTRTCEDITRIVSRTCDASYDSVASEVAHVVAELADLALIESAALARDVRRV